MSSSVERLVLLTPPLAATDSINAARIAKHLNLCPDADVVASGGGIYLRQFAARVGNCPPNNQSRLVLLPYLGTTDFHHEGHEIQMQSLINSVGPATLDVYLDHAKELIRQHTAWLRNQFQFWLEELQYSDARIVVAVCEPVRLALLAYGFTLQSPVDQMRIAKIAFGDKFAGLDIGFGTNGRLMSIRGVPYVSPGT